jgi:hypothetical protein
MNMDGLQLEIYRLEKLVVSQRQKHSLEVKRLEKMAVILAEQLNKKIDQNTELKSELAQLRK